MPRVPAVAGGVCVVVRIGPPAPRTGPRLHVNGTERALTVALPGLCGAGKVLFAHLQGCCVRGCYAT